MTPRLLAARHVRDHVLYVRFADGVEGEVDLKAELWGEVFEGLQDPAAFAAFRLDPELGTVVWPSGADLAPELLYGRALLGSL